MWLAETAQTQGSWLGLVFPLVVMVVLFYLLIMRPQQKQQKARRDLLESIRKGDSVLTVGGLHGQVLNLREDDLDLQIADGVKVKLARSGISRVIRKDEQTESEPEKQQTNTDS